jgi:CheY-like chemotaxis protein
LIVPTILVADDNSNIQKMVSLVFKEKGIRVVAVGNGEAACRKVPEVQPDVVLADVFMPVRNGYEVCEFVKQDPQFAETPVILLVGAFDPLDEKEAQRVGANGVLKKPFVPPEPLIAMVSSLLKLEPPVEEPQPASAPADSLTPQTPEESGPTARQMAIAAAQAQYADTDETVTTFSAPVATPATQAQEIEKEVEDSEPASEWARRRATMNYEIDSADSANMVEKLAAETRVEEPEILASSKHLPFGGANVPETLSQPLAESSPAKCPDSVAPEMTVEPIVEASAQQTAVPEISVPLDAPTPAKSFFDSLPRRESDFESAEPSPTSVDEIAVPAPEPAQKAPAPWVSAPAAEDPAAQTRDAVSEAASASWPLPDANVEPEEVSAPSHASAVEESHEPHSASRPSQEPPLALPEAVSYAAHELTQTLSEQAAPAVEASAEQPLAEAPIDQATVDDVVAKVISKLEPQLHQALANGVLRPLVEEVLNQQRNKK